MKIAIVYDSRSGTTEAAAHQMAAAFVLRGHQCQVTAVARASAEEAATADLLCVGTPTRGLLVFGQHATAEISQFLQRLGNLQGRRALVFCPYKVAIGKTLERMARVLRLRDANVIGAFEFRGPAPSPAFHRFAGDLAATH